MNREYSIAEARDRFSEVVRRAERGEPVTLTRRGRSVAVLMSEREFARLHGRQPSFWDRLSAFRRKENLDREGIDPETFDDVRDTSPGREAAW